MHIFCNHTNQVSLRRKMIPAFSFSLHALLKLIKTKSTDRNKWRSAEDRRKRECENHYPLTKQAKTWKNQTFEFKTTKHRKPRNSLALRNAGSQRSQKSSTQSKALFSPFSGLVFSANKHASWAPDAAGDQQECQVSESELWFAMELYGNSEWEILGRWRKSLFPAANRSERDFGKEEKKKARGNSKIRGRKLSTIGSFDKIMVKISWMIRIMWNREKYCLGIAGME